MLVTASIQIWIDALYRDSSKGLFNYAIMHLCICFFELYANLFKLHITYNIIYILYYMLIFYLR